MEDWQDLPLLPSGATSVAGGGANNRYAGQQLFQDLIPVRMPNKRGWSAINTPALASPFGVSGGAIRGIAYIYGGNNDENSIWSVVGSHLWRGANDEGALPGIAFATGLVQIIGAGENKAVICDPLSQMAWCADFSTGTMVFTAITLPSGRGIAAVAWQDGQTIYLEANSNVWWISAIDDPTTIGGLDFTSADAVADRNVGIISVNQELLIFGERHVEFWYDSGDNTFPFKRQQPGTVNVGLLDACAITSHNGVAYFSSRDGAVYAMQGYQPKRISTRDVEQFVNHVKLACLSSYSDAAGHDFLCVSVPSLGVAVYSITDDVWHLRMHSTTDNSVTYYAGTVTLNDVTYVAANPSIAAGAHSDVYVFDETVFRDSNVAQDISRALVLPTFDASGRRVFESDVRLDMARTLGVAGKVAFAYCDSTSPDLATAQGFITHGTSDYQGAGAGQSTDQDRFAWPRCGSYRQRTHRFDIQANARITINGAQHRFEVGGA